MARPTKADPGTLYAFAHQLYWDFVRVDEGGQRLFFDKTKFERFEQSLSRKRPRITASQKNRIAEVIDDDTRNGLKTASEREKAIADAVQSQYSMNREHLLRRRHEAATSLKRIPGEPDVIDALLRARSAGQVHAICKDAWTTRTSDIEPGRVSDKWPNWNIPYGSTLPTYLSAHADAFLAAKQDKRFPKATRPTSRRKQLWFLSRALAGAVFGVTTRTAINLVGSTRPDELFEHSRAAKPQRRRRRVIVRKK